MDGSGGLRIDLFEKDAEARLALVDQDKVNEKTRKLDFEIKEV